MTELWNQNAWQIPWVVVVIASVFACASDLKSRRIPNVLTGPLLLGGLIWSSAVGGWAGFAEAMLSCVMLALPFVLLYAFAGGGAGDAKLMGAIGTWTGLWGGVIVLTSVALIGGVFGIVYALMNREGRMLAANLGYRFLSLWAVALGHINRDDATHMVGETERKTQPMPYGTAIVVGVIVSAVVTWIWHT